MPYQNVTVALPADLVREARHLAVDQGVSLSRFVAMLIEERVAADLEYRAAMGPWRAIHFSSRRNVREEAKSSSLVDHPHGCCGANPRLSPVWAQKRLTACWRCSSA